MFRDVLKELREDHEHTQADLAKMLGVAKSTVSNWEQKKSRPSFEQLCQICELYDVTADYLLGRTSDDPLLRKKRHNMLSKENSIVISTFEKSLLFEQKKEAKK